MRWLLVSGKHVSLKTRLLVTLITAAVCVAVIGTFYYYQASRYLEHYREAEAVASCWPPLTPVVESDRLVAFREQLAGGQWQTLGTVETPCGEAIAHIGFSQDMDGIAEFLGMELPPFSYWKLKSLVTPIVATKFREKPYFQADDGVFHLNADASVGLLFVPFEPGDPQFVHYFHQTEQGLMQGTLVHFSEEKRKAFAESLDVLPKPTL